jgi:hypothetical protein
VRRRDGEPNGVVPPVELVEYRVWCRSRRLRPFGVAGNEGSLRGAFARWQAWCDEREAWAQRNGVDEEDMDMPGPAPIDPGLLF